MDTAEIIVSEVDSALHNLRASDRVHVVYYTYTALRRTCWLRQKIGSWIPIDATVRSHIYKKYVILLANRRSTRRRRGRWGTIKPGRVGFILYRDFTAIQDHSARSLAFAAAVVCH